MSSSRSLLLFTFMFTLFLSGCSQNQDQELTQRQIEKLVLVARPRFDSADTWAKAIRESLQEIDQPVDKTRICAVIAVIAEESGFKVVPENNSLSELIRNRIENAAISKSQQQLVQVRLDQRASNGKTFRDNLDSTINEKDFEVWYNEFTSANLPKPLLLDLNSAIGNMLANRGSMRVSLKFAKQYSKKPNNVEKGTTLDILYTCKGGIFYGTACLLDFKHNYDDWSYVFADYMAGHYTCRNAGFQKMLSRMARKKIEPNGELFSQDMGNNSTSVTYSTFIALLKKEGIRFNEEAVKTDFMQAKSYEFQQSYSYMTLAEMYKKKYGHTIYAVLPRIPLQTPKYFTKDLAPKWYAIRLNSRFKHYMKMRI